MTVSAELPLNNDSDSNSSENENNDGGLLSFDSEILLEVPKYLPKSEPKLSSELPAATAAVEAAAGTNVLLREEKLVISDKLNILFPETVKTFAEVSNVRPKYELVIPNIDVFAKALDKGITPKELQFLMEAKISNSVKDCIV